MARTLETRWDQALQAEQKLGEDYDRFLQTTPAELSDEERAEFARLPFNERHYRNEIGAPKLFGERGYTTLERVWARPTFEVNGLLSGFTGDGAKTVIPAFRLP